MPVTGLTNLSELSENQSPEQGANTTGTSKQVEPKPELTSELPADTYTPSTQNQNTQATAQDAGIFQVSQPTISATSAINLTAQANLPKLVANAARAQTGTTGPSQVAAATITVVQTPAQPSQPAALPAKENTTGEPQTLNSTLLGLGLTNSDIQYIDRIASSISNYSPTEYTDLVQQFQTQAAQESAIPTKVDTVATQSNVTSSQGPGEK